MNTIRTTIVDGYVHVPVSDDLPNGTEVEVRILALTSESKPGDGDWDDSPEGIKAWMKQYDAIEPFILTESDRAVMTTALQEKKDWEKSRFSDQADKQTKLWEQSDTCSIAICCHPTLIDANQSPNEFGTQYDATVVSGRVSPWSRR